MGGEKIEKDYLTQKGIRKIVDEERCSSETAKKEGYVWILSD